jgi:23S rRNA pseudouridine1911/1915/1917 synthase
MHFGGSHPTSRPRFNLNLRAIAIAHLRKLTVPHAEPLLAFLLRVLESKRTAIKNLLKYGAVSVNGTTVRQFDFGLAPGDQVTIGELKAAAATNRLAAARIQIVFEDSAILVVDKPSGLLTVATDNEKSDTLFFRLHEFLEQRDRKLAVRPQVVHRLDEETSGLVIFAKSVELKQRLQASWSTVEKTYWVVVEGQPQQDIGTINSYLVESKSFQVHAYDRPREGSQRATTHYRRLTTHDGLSLLEVRLETGRKHQIRVQLASLGCPVTGDHRYGAKLDACKRLALHAGRLEFIHPATEKRVSLEAPIPHVMSQLFPGAESNLKRNQGANRSN